MASPASSTSSGQPEAALIHVWDEQLCVDASLPDGVGDAADRQHVCGNPVVHAMRFGEVNYIFERLAQDELQLLVDCGFFPEVTLPVLHPLEVRSGYATGVGENVRNHEHLLIRQNLVGRSGGGTVRAFTNNLGLDAGGVLAANHVFDRRRYQDVASGDQQISRVRRLGTRKADNAAVVAVTILEQRVDIDTARVVKPAVVFRDTHDLVSGIGHQLRRVEADVAKALDDDTRAVPRHLEFLQGFVADDHDAAACGFTAAARPANVDRLAGDNSRHRLPHVHGIGVHHPGHGLFVRVDIGCGYIFLGAEEFDQLRGVAARQLLQFGERQFFGINNNASLGTAEGNVDYGAFPRHPAGKSAHLVEGDVGRVAHAALGRSAGNGMLYAETGEDFEGPVVHRHRDVNDDL